MDTIKVKTIHEITFSAAEKLLQFGLEEATKKNLKLSIAIVDRAGQLIAFARMDGASIVTIDVAIGKAKTGAYLQAPSKVFEDFINNGLPSMATTPGILPLQGGIPIMYNNEVIGAVGVSGSTGESDNEMAINIANHIN